MKPTREKSKVFQVSMRPTVYQQAEEKSEKFLGIKNVSTFISLLITNSDKILNNKTDKAIEIMASILKELKKH